ncbi:hypothetical protein ACFQ68_36420 [Amycolatopsis japonica]|uniref:VG15 protein n=1 Tax=Amycolatopsis japonica TaxID=208439 RepID=UPI00366F497B
MTPRTNSDQIPGSVGLLTPPEKDRYRERFAVLVECADATTQAAESYRAARIKALFNATDDQATRFELEVEDDRWRERVLTSLPVTSTRTVARLVGAGLDLVRILNQTGPGVAAASVRHTLAAGRSRVERATAADPAARGWLRVTDGDPCWWCAMLASRGAVYLSRESACTRGGTEDEYHNGCGCQPEPFFHMPMLPDTTREFAALWTDATQGLSGKDARLAFRRAYEARRANAS